MDLNLIGKNALVCGSSKGIGKAAAIELAELGATITLVSRSAERMTEVQKELNKKVTMAHDFIVADFNDPDDLKKKIKFLTTSKPFEILVNNTGGPPGGAITDASTDDFEQAFRKHLICNHVLVQTVLKGMKKSGYGRIINIISTSVKEPLEGLGVSNTIRNAVANWAKTLANELGPFGITVNNVLPGYTDTQRLQEIISDRAKAAGISKDTMMEKMKNQVPLKRFGTPAEIGAAVAFLASPAAAFITGSNLTVDGGRTKSL